MTFGKNVKTSSTQISKKLTLYRIGRASPKFQLRLIFRLDTPSWPSWQCLGNLMLRNFGSPLVNWGIGPSVDTINKYTLRQAWFRHTATPTRFSKDLGECFKGFNSKSKSAKSSYGKMGCWFWEQEWQSFRSM